MTWPTTKTAATNIDKTPLKHWSSPLRLDSRRRPTVKHGAPYFFRSSCVPHYYNLITACTGGYFYMSWFNANTVHYMYYNRSELEQLQRRSTTTYLQCATVTTQFLSSITHPQRWTKPLCSTLHFLHHNKHHSPDTNLISHSPLCTTVYDDPIKWLCVAASRIAIGNKCYRIYRLIQKVSRHYRISNESN